MLLTGMGLSDVWTLGIQLRESLWIVQTCIQQPYVPTRTSKGTRKRGSKDFTI